MDVVKGNFEEALSSIEALIKKVEIACLIFIIGSSIRELRLRVYRNKRKARTHDRYS